MYRNRICNHGLFNYFLTDVWVFRKPKYTPEENS